MAYTDEYGNDFNDQSPADLSTPDPYYQARYDSIANMYRNALGREGSPDEINGWANGLAATDMAAAQQAIYGSAEAQAYNNRGQQQQQAPPPATGGGPTGGGEGGGTLGSLIDPSRGSFTAPAPINQGGPGGISYIPPTPTYTPPGYTPPPAFSYGEFVAPDAQTVLSRPGYEFRRKEGERTILNDRAHSGLLNTGSTLRDIIGYGQDYATNEYGNEWNRAANEYSLNRANALGIYNTNYQTQYQDPYQINRQASLDAFAPKMVGYQTEAAAGQHQNDLNWSHAFDLSNFDWNKYKDLRDFTWNSNYQLASS